MSATKAISLALVTRANRFVTRLNHSACNRLRENLSAPLYDSCRRSFSSKKSTQKERQGETDAGTAQHETPGATKKPGPNFEALRKEISELKEKHDALMDKYKRALAESENMRNRLDKQITGAKVFGIQSFCKDLLEVADTLGHATDAVPQDQINENNPHLINLFKALVMTTASLLHAFKRHGLEAINPINEKFDPNMHEALFEKEEPKVSPRTVIVVTKLGYKLHDRCIRPALVGVSKS